ncbi:hypothetical protein Tco_1313244 [Tanacetum coccineum]
MRSSSPEPLFSSSSESDKRALLGLSSKQPSKSFLNPPSEVVDWSRLMVVQCMPLIGSCAGEGEGDAVVVSAIGVGGAG